MEEPSSIHDSANGNIHAVYPAAETPDGYFVPPANLRPQPVTRPARKRRGATIALAAFLLLVLLAAIAAFGAWNYGFVDDWIAASPIEAAEDEALAEAYYAYSQLDEADRERYRIVLRALETRETQPYPHGDIESYRRIFHCVTADHPELADVTAITRTSSTVLGGTMIRSAAVEAQFAYPPEYAHMVDIQVEAAAAACLEGLPEGADDYATARYLYDWIAENVSYDHEAAGLPDDDLLGSPTQTVEGALVNGRAVCGGYASAYQYLMQRCGLQCVRVMGTAGGEHHAWCLAKLDGDYYYIDPTWADPQSSDDDELGEADWGYVNYDYLCVPGADMARTHVPDVDFALPECVAVSDNYYVREQLLFASADEDRLGALVADAQKRGEALQVRCTDAPVYTRLRDEFVSTGDLGVYVPGGAYRYICSDDTYSITVLSA